MTSPAHPPPRVGVLALLGALLLPPVLAHANGDGDGNFHLQTSSGSGDILGGRSEHDPWPAALPGGSGKAISGPAMSGPAIAAPSISGAAISGPAIATPVMLGPAVADTPGDEAIRATERQVLVMLRLPAPHYRPDANYGGRYVDDGGRSARRRIAAELARRHGLSLLGDWPMPTLGLDCYLMSFPAGDNAEHVAALLSHDPRVEWAQPVALYQGLAATPPPAAGAVAALYPVQPAARDWHVAELHRASTGRDVLVAVLDSGVDRRHPDLAGQIALAEDFVDAQHDADGDHAEPHGTAVAGIIAARGAGAGIVGIAPAARLMALRACWQPAGAGARCSSFTLGKALNYAILHRAGVINLSLTGPPDRLLDKLLDVALARGISVVGALAAPGQAAGFPAGHPGVIAVAQQGNPAGDTPAAAPRPAAPRDALLLAPGRDIPASAPGGGWRFVSGNSFAAAHVSGMLALLRELRPDADPAQLQRLLHPAPGPTTATIDACATIARAAGACPCSCATAATVSSHSHP